MKATVNNIDNQLNATITVY